MAKMTHEKRVEYATQETPPTKAEKDQALTVRKSNQLIQRNRFDLSLREQRLLLYCISRIKPTDHGTETYEISIRDVCKACGIEETINGGAYNAMKNALKKLDSFNFELKEQNGRIHLVHWIRSVVIDPEFKNQARVRFEFDPKIVPYLFDVRKYFTQYELRGVLQMKSVYGVRLYELLKSYANIREQEFELGELRRQLCAESKSYDKYGLFRTYVLEPAIKDIMAYSDLKVDYVEIKQGRKVINIRFIITNIGGTAEYYERMGFKFDD